MQEVKEQSTFSRLKEFAQPQKGSYIASVIIAVIGVASGIIPYYAMARIIIELINGSRELSLYVPWCVVAAAGFILKVLFANISTAMSHKATFSVLSEVRFRITSKLTRLPMGYILDTPSGRLKTTLVEKVDSIEPTLAHVLPEMTSNLLVPLAIIVYLFTLDWRMALVSLITLPIGTLCYMGTTKNYAEKFAVYTNAGKHTDVEEIGPCVMDKTVHGFIHALIIAVSVMIFDWRIGLVIIAGILLFIIRKRRKKPAAMSLSQRSQTATTR